MESVELYLVVERARFGSRIETTLILPAELEDVRVPSLLLQPLVENAVKHGVARRDGTCSITVQAETDSMMVRISVMDDGPGFPQEPMEQILARGHGLRNIRERLRLVYGGDADMSFRNDGVILSLPIHIVETEEPRVDHLLHR
jgi:LytS/YehU family sensor histidine kinase